MTKETLKNHKMRYGRMFVKCAVPILGILFTIYITAIGNINYIPIPMALVAGGYVTTDDYDVPIFRNAFTVIVYLLSVILIIASIYSYNLWVVLVGSILWVIGAAIN